MRLVLPMVSLCSLLVACKESGPSQKVIEAGMVMGVAQSWDWRATLPLDSNKLLELLDLSDSASTIVYDQGGAIAWRKQTDTITVKNMMYACTCPDHAVLDSARFGVEAVYIQPANDSVAIPERMRVVGNTFVLIGQRSVDTLRPPQTVDPPWPGYFFRYLSYRVIRPYTVWGPHVFDATADTAAGEDPWIPSQLTVR